MARWNPTKFQKKLDSALIDCDYSQCSVLCHELITHLYASVVPYEAGDAKKILQSLRRKRYFDLMSLTADAFWRTGLSSPQIYRLYAQSMLDQGNIFGSLAVLHDILADPGISRRERAEARGLIGRAYKQIYTDAKDSRPPHNKEALRKSIEAYYDVYEEDTEKYLWHGINAVALFERAHRDGISTDDLADAENITETITKHIVELLGDDDARGQSMWNLATLSEAYVAQKNWKNAAKYLRRYVEKSDADAFEIEATYRQFGEVWQLDSDEVQERALMDLLRSKLLESSGGEITTSADNIAKIIETADNSEDGLEALLGETKYQSYRWMLLAMQNARCVGRIRRGGTGIGTGFLISGETLCEAWDGQQVFVTNNHVVSKPRSTTIAILPQQAEITFDVLDGGIEPKRYKVEELLWQSPIGEYDTTILRLNEKVEGYEDLIVAAEMPSNRGKDRIYVIGHPKGGDLSFSFQDNLLLDFNDDRIHYRSPTERGSSGSPIFNGNWELIGLHHSGSEDMPKLDGSGMYPANEGIPLPSIKKALTELV